MQEPYHLSTIEQPWCIFRTTFAEKQAVHLKGRPTVQTSPHSASVPHGSVSNVAEEPRRSEDLVYQGMTIAAILIVLVSVWVF